MAVTVCTVDLPVVPTDLGSGLHDWLAEIRAAPTSVCPMRTRSHSVVHVVSRSEDVRQALLHPALVVRGSGSAQRTSGNLIAPASREHASRRAITAGLLSRSSLDPWAHRLARLAAEHAADLPTDRPFELNEAFCRPFVSSAIAEVFGITADPPTLRAALESVFDRTPGRRLERAAAIEVLTAAVSAEVDDRIGAAGRSFRRSDLISRFTTRIRAGATQEPDWLRDTTISLVLTLVLGGFGSTVQSIAFTVNTLTAADDTGAQWRSAAEPRRAAALIAEVLRLDSPGPFASPRIATEDLVIGDSEIRSGATVLIALAGADRDGEVFAEADRFRPDRTERAARHTFGVGEHRCPGAVLARMEVVAAICALARRLPAPVLQPSPRWRGSLTSRGLDVLTVLNRSQHHLTPGLPTAGGSVGGAPCTSLIPVPDPIPTTVQEVMTTCSPTPPKISTTKSM